MKTIIQIGNRLLIGLFSGKFILQKCRNIFFPGKLCKDIFKDDSTKQFFLYDEKSIENNLRSFDAELSLSLDVIYHLVKDEVYGKYMNNLFSCSTNYVIIYAWDLEEGKKYHVRHRNFSK